MKLVRLSLQKLSDKNTIMKIILNKYLYVVLFTCLNVLAFAGAPPIPGGGSTGAGGTGAQASPIDMYVIILATVAIVFAVFFAKRYATQQAK